MFHLLNPTANYSERLDDYLLGQFHCFGHDRHEQPESEMTNLVQFVQQGTNRGLRKTMRYIFDFAQRSRKMLEGLE